MLFIHVFHDFFLLASAFCVSMSVCLYIHVCRVCVFVLIIYAVEHFFLMCVMHNSLLKDGMLFH